jgi:hypothetical protein
VKNIWIYIYIHFPMCLHAVGLNYLIN